MVERASFDWRTLTQAEQEKEKAKVDAITTYSYIRLPCRSFIDWLRNEGLRELRKAIAAEETVQKRKMKKVSPSKRGPGATTQGVGYLEHEEPGEEEEEEEEEEEGEAEAAKRPKL